MPRAVPVIFAPLVNPIRLPWRGRALSALVAAACLAVLWLAAYLEPDPAGVGTTSRLGLQPCGMQQRLDFPCAACGMTTSFNHFARGQVLSSFWVQPMGFLLAVTTCVTFWASAYIAATGRPAHRLLKRLPAVKVTILAIALGIAAWGWKIGLSFAGMAGAPAWSW